MTISNLRVHFSRRSRDRRWCNLPDTLCTQSMVAFRYSLSNLPHSHVVRLCIGSYVLPSNQVFDILASSSLRAYSHRTLGFWLLAQSIESTSDRVLHRGAARAHQQNQRQVCAHAACILKALRKCIREVFSANRLKESGVCRVGLAFR